jgi:hypothetical protein
MGHFVDILKAIKQMTRDPVFDIKLRGSTTGTGPLQTLLCLINVSLRLLLRLNCAFG